MLDPTKQEWVIYHHVKSKGFISGNRQSNIFQVIEDEHIHFFEMDEATQLPTLKNVMMNYMHCGMMIFGEHQKFCITFKSNQADFNLYQRKMQHRFKVKVCSEDFENA